MTRFTPFQTGREPACQGLASRAWLVVLCTLTGPALAACDEPERRQFDFWIGHWRVENPDGQVVGENRIEPILNGCALHEQWRGKDGTSGQSFNSYLPGRDQWQQTWVDGNGMTLHLVGAWADGKMSLAGRRTTPSGQTVFDRITWQSQDDGSVRQLWEAGPDESQMNVVFDGRYRRIEP